MYCSAIIIISIFCCTAGFDILSLRLHPSLSSTKCNKAIIICQVMWHLNSSSPSCWFTSHSAFNNFTQKPVVSLTSDGGFPTHSLTLSGPLLATFTMLIIYCVCVCVCVCVCLFAEANSASYPRRDGE